MAFITLEDYQTHISLEELDVITGYNENTRKQAEKNAIEKIKMRLSRQYDTEQIFSEVGTNRNLVIVECVIHYTLYALYGRIAKERVPDDAYIRYKDAKELIDLLAEDKINSDLPKKEDILGTEDSPPIRFGSEQKLRTE